ncbi:MAG: creatinine amidohydrolase [Thermomicrobiales bacterium]|nr:creatinine amidohydrolase [Thermomicrobiales bacterium]
MRPGGVPPGHHRKGPNGVVADCAVFGAGQRGTTGRTVHWQELWRHELHAARLRNPVVIVPVGSVEQHGPHCPMDVDISHTQALAVATAQAIDDFPVIVAPPIWCGLTHYNMGEIGTISLSVETFIALVSDICRSIWANGFLRLVLLNGHGGNRDILRVVSIKLAEEDIWVLPITHWEMVQGVMKDAGERDHFIGHGGEWETSLQLYLRPDLIDPSRIVADPERPGFTDDVLAFTGFPERRRERAHGVHGDPTVASAEKGERFFKAATERLVEVCRQYHEQPVRRYREFGSHCP